jgi:acetyltransferase-like isoleucine patch superfamily enzyme
MDAAQFRGSWDRSLLPSNVRLGEGAYLEGLHSLKRFRSEREPGLILGAGVRVYTWTDFNVEPSGFVEIGEGSTVVGAVFMCAERISVGRHVIISYHVTIADSDFHPFEASDRRKDAIANAPDAVAGDRPRLVSRPVVIEDGAWVGVGAIILKGVTVGSGARVGAGTVITKDVPAQTWWEGNPARLVGAP